eukprot:3170223-Prymnesium_polylepis.1
MGDSGGRVVAWVPRPNGAAIRRSANLRRVGVREARGRITAPAGACQLPRHGDACAVRKAPPAAAAAATTGAAATTAAAVINRIYDLREEIADIAAPHDERQVSQDHHLRLESGEQHIVNLVDVVRLEARWC